MRTSTFAFFKGFFLNPRTTGAVLPSSHYLADSMIKCIDASKPGFVLELGPGTGVMTKAMIRAGIAPQKIVSLELSEDFAKELQLELPNIAVIKGNAINLSSLMNAYQPIHTIISSLPLRSLSKKDREAIFAEVAKVLAPQGRFIQFTYSLKKNRNFYPSNFVLKKSFIVWRNFPPAKVTVFEVQI